MATEECPMYPPRPCDSIWDTTTTSSTVAITTTTVPIVDTGADSLTFLPFAAAALLGGVVLTVLSRRREPKNVECPTCGGEGYIDPESPEWEYGHDCPDCTPENVETSNE